MNEKQIIDSFIKHIPYLGRLYLSGETCSDVVENIIEVSQEGNEARRDIVYNSEDYEWLSIVVRDDSVDKGRIAAFVRVEEKTFSIFYFIDKESLAVSGETFSKETFLHIETRGYTLDMFIKLIKEDSIRQLKERLACSQSDADTNEDITLIDEAIKLEAFHCNDGDRKEKVFKLANIFIRYISWFDSKGFGSFEQLIHSGKDNDAIMRAALTQLKRDINNGYKPKHT